MSDFKCSICLEFYSGVNNDCFVRTHCGHVFHKYCLREKNETLGKICPLCGDDFPFFRGKPLPLHGIDPTLRQKQFRVIVIGDSGVGKSALSRKYTEGIYIEAQPSTVGQDYWTKIVSVGSESIKLHIGDTSGQERYDSLTPQFIRNSQGVIIVYDTSNYKTLANVPKWYGLANQHAPNAVKVLVGAKSDLTECSIAPTPSGAVHRRTTNAEKQEVAKSFGMNAFETSSKKDVNIDVAFKNIIEQILQNPFLLYQANNLFCNKLMNDATSRPQAQKSKCC